MDVQAISTAIAHAFKDIRVGANGLNTYDYASDVPNAPCVYIYPTATEYDTTVSVDEPKFAVRFLISSTATKSGQADLNRLISTNTEGSAVDAIRADNSLGGAVNSCRIESMRNYGVITLPDTTRYFSAELVLDVLAK